MITLRDYQQDLYDKSREAFRHGKRRPLVVAPCGAGKTFLFLAMSKEASKKGEVLVLCHRRELIAQHIRLFEENGIDMTNIRVESVFTEVNRLDQHEPPALIVLDEAHLSRSNSWVTVIEHYGSRCVGFTATPCRLDGRPLGDVFDELIEGVDVKWLIENKRLSPYEYYAPRTVDVSGLKSSYGDFSVNDVEPLVMDKAIYGDVVGSYKKIANGKKAIAYCVSVKHSKEVVEAFNSAGIKAAHIDGETPTAEREQIMADFREGKITVLSNVSLIVEGISIDDCECCLLLSPTESLARFIQSSMRCMRYKEGKTAIIIDYVGNYTRHGMPDSPRDWELKKPAKKFQHQKSDGTFTIRQCPKCFKVFEASDTCPYCGEPYPLHPREIKAIEDIEIKRLEAEEIARLEKQRKQERMEVGRATTKAELMEIAKARGYKIGWVFKQMKIKGIRG